LIEITLSLYPKNEIIRLASCLSIGILIKKSPSLLLIVEMFDPETVMLAKVN
jgi:hypothetical protein